MARVIISVIDDDFEIRSGCNQSEIRLEMQPDGDAVVMFPGKEGDLGLVINAENIN